MPAETDRELRALDLYIVSAPGEHAGGPTATVMSPQHEDDGPGPWNAFFGTAGPRNTHDSVLTLLAAIALTELAGGRLERDGHFWFGRDAGTPQEWLAALEERLRAAPSRPANLCALGAWYEELA